MARIIQNCKKAFRHQLQTVIIWNYVNIFSILCFIVGISITECITSVNFRH